MAKTLKTCLVLMLISSLALLPLRAAFAMSGGNTGDTVSTGNMADTDTSSLSDHCKNMMMDMSNDISSDQNAPSNNSACCDQCDGDCGHCIGSISAIESQNLDLISQYYFDGHNVTIKSAISRSLAPPSRPPLTHKI